MSKSDKIPIRDALPTALHIQKLCELMGYYVQVCGSIRRKCAEVGDLDFICREDTGTPLCGSIRPLRAVLDEIDRGGDKTIIGTFGRFKVNFFYIPEESWGAGLLFATGDGAFNRLCRANAKAQGRKLNRYGLFEGQRNIAEGRSEKWILEEVTARGWIPPSKRDRALKKGQSSGPIIVQEFPSTSSGGTYTASINTRTCVSSCTCKGFLFRGKCKHTEELESRL
ncbi:MAG: hypothetical protein GF334_08705 [Candidatus Altiarchaeales archaeon]|nr:hypothetical protein [Candidatus Altiarchaeales archaeon]